MQTYVNPSVLQSAALPIFKKKKDKNMIIKYSEMSGIKLTVLVPLLDKQIKYAVSKFGSEDGQSDAKIIYTLVICYSNGRCHEYAEFAN